MIPTTAEARRTHHSRGSAFDKKSEQTDAEWLVYRSVLAREMLSRCTRKVSAACVWQHHRRVCRRYMNEA